MKLAFLLAAGLALGFVPPATAQRIFVTPGAPVIARTCAVTQLRPDTSKLVSIERNGAVTTTQLGGGDMLSTTTVCTGP
jgi:hypothetical protein